MDLETIFYIAMFILFSVFSGAANRKKKKKEEERKGPTLEEEIRRMQEQILGRREAAQPVERPSQPERPIDRNPYGRLEDEAEETQRYKPVERQDYSQEDIKKIEQQYESYRTSNSYEVTPNYEEKSVEALKKGQELHSVMDTTKDNTFKPANPIEEATEHIDFDARRAIIYSEILRRPEY